MKSKKKVKLIEFHKVENLFSKCRSDFLKSKSILISGGTTFDFFLKIFKKRKKTYNKNLILFDERVTSVKKKRNFYKINKYFIKNKIISKNKFFNFESIINKVDLNKLNFLEKKINKYKNPDLALIGVGNDGHIGSIFSNSKNITENFLVSKKINENFQRISFSFNFLKKIKKIILVINDKNKKNILNKFLSNNKKKNNIPVFKLLEIASKKIFLYYIKY